LTDGLQQNVSVDTLVSGVGDERDVQCGSHSH
jgi:hypothetical protein